MTTDFDRALSLLGLTGIEELETQFLNTDAFLRPWAYFRDSFLLIQPSGMPRATFPGQITRMDILHWYTLFDEGEKRYEPSADPQSPVYASKEPKLWVVDKSWWGVMEYERLLYVWLLQSFKVGKSTNAYGFNYFECLNVCTAWDDVFRPIVELVRDDYNVKGRYHYGRLAKFIEEACPSGLAFPEATLNTHRDPVQVPGFHPKSTIETGVIDPITGVWRSNRKIWDEEDKELRAVYPQYGQVVEKPKKNLLNWVREKRNQIQRDRALRQLEGRYLQSTMKDHPSQQSRASRRDEQTPNINSEKHSGKLNDHKQQAVNLYKPPFKRDESNYSHGGEPPSPSPNRPGFPRGRSDGVYSSIRFSNPYAEAAGHIFGSYTPRASDRTANSSKYAAAVPMNTESVPPEQLFNTPTQHTVPHTEKAVEPIALTNRSPSYEGNGYGSSFQLPEHKEAQSTTFKTTKTTRIPSPINIPPNEISRRYHAIVEHPTEYSKVMSKAGGTVPPLPGRNPRRYNSISGHVVSPRAVLAAHEPGLLGPRIVSRENIRAHIGDLEEQGEPDDMLTDLGHSNSNKSLTPFAHMGGRGLNTGEGPILPTFSTHMFPRKDSLSKLRIGATRRSYDSGASYELQNVDELERSKREH